MTREENAKLLLPIITAIAEGKQLQFSFNGKTWIDESDELDLRTICDDIIADSRDYRIKPNGNCTVEQNAGENQVEGGKVYTCKDCLRHKFCYLAEKRKDKACTKISLCKEAEKQYRPFNDCNELIEHYQKKYKSAVGCDIYFPSLYKPCIWIRDITEDAKGDIELITGFTEHGNVLINGTSYPLQHLFQMYEFLDGTPVGVEE